MSQIKSKARRLRERLLARPNTFITLYDHTTRLEAAKFPTHHTSGRDAMFRHFNAHL